MDHWTPEQCILLPIIALHCFDIRLLGARDVDGENCVNTVEQNLLDKFAVTGHDDCDRERPSHGKTIR